MKIDINYKYNEAQTHTQYKELIRNEKNLTTKKINLLINNEHLKQIIIIIII